MLHSLVGNHPLVDGTKRLAWLATVVFLRLNDSDVAVTDDEAFALVWDNASGSLALEGIRDRLRAEQRRRA